MLKNRKIKDINEEDITKEISDTEYYLGQIKSNILMGFNLNTVNTMKYFNEDFSFELMNYEELCSRIIALLKEYNIDILEISIQKEDYLKIVIKDKELDENIINISQIILNIIRDYYSELDIHITRMFGSFILLKKLNGKLTAIKATPIPIKYCPLMIKLLTEIKGDTALKLINNLQNSDDEVKQKLMCDLINEVVIDGGYFDTNRPLNSCEANVLFGASETIASAFKTNMIDASVIVSNNLGTIITTNASNTQGSVKRMTGLFHTSPSQILYNTAINSDIIPIFPFTASIEQLEGIKKAISLGYKSIAVTLACMDNVLLDSISKLEKEFNVTIYKFGLCSTGIDYNTATIMRDNADVIWSCASKYVKELIEPNSIAQVGVKIPVHIMSEKGWNIVRNHINLMNNNLDEVTLTTGSDKPVLVNNCGTIVKVKKKNLRKCYDCPHPCV